MKGIRYFLEQHTFDMVLMLVSVQVYDNLVKSVSQSLSCKWYADVFEDQSWLFAWNTPSPVYLHPSIYIFSQPKDIDQFIIRIVKLSGQMIVKITMI